MEPIGLWDIKGSKVYIYAAFKNRSDEGISRDKKWRYWIRICHNCHTTIQKWILAAAMWIFMLIIKKSSNARLPSPTSEKVQTEQATAHYLAQIIFFSIFHCKTIYVCVSVKAICLWVCVFDRKRAENLNLWCATGAVSPAGNKAS